MSRFLKRGMLACPNKCRLWPSCLEFRVHLLEVRNLFKTFDVKSITTLNKISFSIKKGEVVSMIGPSGTGKSTTAKIIKGLVNTDDGEVYLSGELMISSSEKNEKLIKKNKT